MKNKFKEKISKLESKLGTLGVGQTILDTIDNNTYKIVGVKNNGYVFQNMNKHGPMWESGSKRDQKHFFSFKAVEDGLKKGDFKTASSGKDSSAVVYGRKFHTKLFHSQKEANEFMEKNDDWGVLLVSGNDIHLAKIHDHGSPIHDPRAKHANLELEKLMTEYGFQLHTPEIKQEWKHKNGSRMMIFNHGNWAVKDPHGQILGKGSLNDLDRLEKALGVAS